jgi:hypothetical protein
MVFLGLARSVSTEGAGAGGRAPLEELRLIPPISNSAATPVDLRSMKVDIALSRGKPEKPPMEVGFTR